MNISEKYYFSYEFDMVPQSTAQIVREDSLVQYVVWS